MKRSRVSSSLTGGTGDVNPQWLKATVLQTGADTTTTATIVLPVTRLASPANPTIIEVLKVYWILTNQAEVDSTQTGHLSTKNFDTTAISGFIEPSDIDAVYWTDKITTSGQFANFQPIEHDLTDGMGHGVLVATDNLYLQLASASTSAANRASVWILYRFKRVNVQEYIGIVQSQQ